MWVKAVPGASREAVAGAVGARLKIRVQAPPEAGKANQAICRLLARTLGVKTHAVTVASGHTTTEKIVRIRDLTPSALRKRLGLE
ncbi:MAG: DUF167 domain-containing protein [Phycisphaerales bacterium]|nr:DUF167 domain-containing protein [Phycisphaerae bacterium]NNF42447.1 DUF167 domain-containing protein [Phycisphaerales bacterium]NNM24898.1 DUF167 domain-containing protein [Phycisphaerales bacterium]